MVLKGGTAINLIVFPLPRLSVDIDFDFSFDGKRSQMIEKRDEITAIIKKYMEANGYALGNETKTRHALDSFAFHYYNRFGNRDHLKIEINYMNRTHIFEPIMRKCSVLFQDPFEIRTLNQYELFGTKIKALIERCTIRDFYDVYHMLKENIFHENELHIIKKCVIFYMLIGNSTSSSFHETFNGFSLKIGQYESDKIPQYLSSTLQREDQFSTKNAVLQVKGFVSDLMKLSENDERFIREFEQGNYCPEIEFDDPDIVHRIQNHPMAVWKTSHR